MWNYVITCYVLHPAVHLSPIWKLQTESLLLMHAPAAPRGNKNDQSFLSGQHSYGKWTIYNPLTLDLPIKIVIFPVRYVSLREFTTEGLSKNCRAVAEDMINPWVGESASTVAPQGPTRPRRSNL